MELGRRPTRFVLAARRTPAVLCGRNDLTTVRLGGSRAPISDYNGVVEISSLPLGTRPDVTVTTLLRAIRRGDSAALRALFPLVYDELRLIAHTQRRSWHGDLTLGTTAL